MIGHLNDLIVDILVAVALGDEDGKKGFVLYELNQALGRVHAHLRVLVDGIQKACGLAGLHRWFTSDFFP